MVHAYSEKKRTSNNFDSVQKKVKLGSHLKLQTIDSVIQRHDPYTTLTNESALRRTEVRYSTSTGPLPVIR